MNKKDKTWSIKDEGHLNKGNIVFKSDLIKTTKSIKSQTELGLQKNNDLDEMWVCDWCGSEDIQEQVWINMNATEISWGVVTAGDDQFWCGTCENEARPMTYFEWQEKIAEECMGNKDEYDKIMDGSRA